MFRYFSKIILSISRIAHTYWTKKHIYRIVPIHCKYILYNTQIRVYHHAYNYLLRVYGSSHDVQMSAQPNAITPKRSHIVRYRSREDGAVEARRTRDTESHTNAIRKFGSAHTAGTVPESGCKFKHVRLYWSYEIYLFDRAWKSATDMTL